MAELTKARMYALELRVKKLEKLVKSLLGRCADQGDWIKRKRDQESEYW